MSSRIFTLVNLLILVTSLGPWMAVCPAQTEIDHIPSSTIDPAERKAVQVELGLGGFWKLGQLCPVRLQLDEALQRSARAIEIRSVDGDGVEVLYRRVLSAADLSNSGLIWMPIRIGRLQPRIELRVLGDDAQPLYGETLEGQSLGSVLPSHQPLVVALGSSMGVEALSRTSTDGSNATFTTVLLKSAHDIPPDPSVYTSCDLLLISGGDTQLLQSMSGQQWTAVDDWIRRGGAAIISLGEQAQSLSSLQPLNDLLPGPLVGVGSISNPAMLESFVGTEDPLDSFGCALIEPQRGRIDLTLTDSLSRTVSWWLTYSHGLGTIRFVASDLDEPAFAGWDDRPRLWGRIIAPYLDRALTDNVDDQATGEASYLGYNDMVGQLRATLDLFPSVRVVSFGQVAAMLIGVLLLIGPIDYFVSVKWLKRPELSWILAGTSLVAISVGLTVLIATIRPNEIHLNSAQIVDIDMSTSDSNQEGVAHGHLWSHVFSGSARELDVTVAATADDVPVSVDWQGLPGQGLGGLLSQLNTDRGMPAYTIESSPAGQTALLGVGIPAAGTKCLVAEWTQKVQLSGTSQLQEIPGVDQLQGVLINPLAVEVLDPVLFYHNWFYSLNSRIPAGGSVAISFDTIPKDISRRLNGRRTIDGNEGTTKWDPADRQSIDRLLELMMFYKSATGKTYTSLSHRFQPHLDQSNLLQTDRAILLCRLAQPWATTRVSLSGHPSSDSPLAPSPSLEVQQDMDRTWCRIIIPVAPASKKK